MAGVDTMSWHLGIAAEVSSATRVRGMAGWQLYIVVQQGTHVTKRIADYESWQGVGTKQ